MPLTRPVYQIMWVFLVVTLTLPAVSHGQAIGMKRNDVTPPVITHTPPPELTEGMPIRIQAVVTDNVGVKEVTLFYREVGSREFQRLSMHEAPGRDIYTADIPLIAGPLIEYFIQAIDLAGNIGPEQLVEPYVIKKSSVDVATADFGHPRESALPQMQAEKKNGVNKWVWVGLGVVAAGAVLMSGNNGGGAANNGEAPSGTGGGTGTVTITGPPP